MRHTRFERTDLEVSRICFGTWQGSGEWGSFEEQDLKDTIRGSLELGINFFDTAQAHGFGTSEKILGQALEDEVEDRWDEMVLATKGASGWKTVRCSGTRAPGGSGRESRSPYVT